MRRSPLVALLATALAGAIPVRAQSPDAIHLSITGEELAAVVREAGFVPEVTRDAQGDPLIRFRVEGITTAIYFYTCQDDRCESYQFAAGFATEQKPSCEAIIAWNRSKRFGRAYLDDDQDPWVELDVDLDGGVTRQYLLASFTTWRSVLLTFAREVAKR